MNKQLSCALKALNVFVLASFSAVISSALAQPTQPLVAIHDSELTRALESMPASGATPTGPGTTGNQWWPTDWHYFVMPEAMKEALRSDGTAFTVVGDSNIVAGILLTNGAPRYPILVSLASEAIRDDEIAAFTNYVAAGGFLFVGSSAFTRNTNGAARSDFAFANQLGVHKVASGLTNWAQNNYFTKANQTGHRLTAHIPNGQNTWRMPSSSDEIPWGISPSHPFLAPHDIWQVQVTDATVLGQGDATPFLTVKPYGKGYFIYCAAFQPLIGHSGFAPGMYAYVIFRRAIEWAFESANLPLPKLSPWPYQYDAALMVRHDLENFTNEIAAIEASAQFEFNNGAKGDYFFCTGTLRDDASPTYNTNSLVASLRRAVTNYGATIGPHNGGLRNPNNPTLVRGQYDYWHWGPDEALDVTPPGYPSGKAYASASISNSFRDVESWLSGITNGLRSWVGCYFNSTRENSYDIQAQLGVKIAGEQKLTPFPHWTLSTVTPGKRYAYLTEPVSDWFVGGLVAQSLEPWHPPGVQTSQTLHSAVDFYYGLGGLINFYSHTLSTGLGDAGQLVPDYITYSLNTNLHPRIWSANAASVYQWWLARSNAQITFSCATNGLQTVAAFSIQGATDPKTSVELLMPGTNAICTVQVYTNGTLAGPSAYRMNGNLVKLLIGSTVTNAIVSYYPMASGVSIFSQNFDGVSAPALPNGWTTSASGVQSPWVTQTPGDTAPNAAFSTDPTYIGINELISPPINIPAGTAQLSFRNNYNLETGAGTDGYDGGVLEIKIGTNAFADILAAGGTFVTGGYNSVIDTAYSNPLAGRQAWSGNSGGYITTTVNLPSAVSGQTIQLRWRCGSDDSNGSTGWRIDTISISGQSCLCCNNSSNTPPVLPAQGNRTIAALATLTVTNTASDADLPPQTLSYQLLSPPAGAGISSSGIITWTPSASQAPSTNTITTVVTDSGSPALSGTNSFVVVVTPANTAPVLPAQSDRTVAELTTLTVTNTATDTDSPPDTLSYTLLAAPSGAAISGSGVITWTPTEAQGPSTNVITTRVMDNGTPPLSATNSFTVVVTEVNSAPLLPAQNNRTISATATLVVTNSGSDPDIPANTLSYSLLVAPVGATISPTGVITWTPTQAQAPSTNTITTQVTDNGVPPLSATNSFLVIVTQSNSPPVITSQPVSRTNIVGTTATFSVTATGSSLAYQWIKNATNNLANGGNISGATSSSLTISNVSLSDAAGYTVQVTNSGGSVLSAPATLTVISTNAGPLLFADDFTRGTDPGPLAQWLVQSGNWTVTGGAFRAGTNAAQSYGFAYVTNSWTNYSVQARVRFNSINGNGGGIGGRVNPVTGAHYAAWIYPEGSLDGPSLLRILKFQDWSSFEYGNVTYQPMAQVSLPGVGTNWHTINLAFQGNQIVASYDGVQVAAAIDTESNPYFTGAISVDMFTDNTVYNMYVDDVSVNALPPILMALNDLYFVNRGGTLTVPAPGVLGNDIAGQQTNLTAARITGPFRGTLTFNSNGGFTYVPTNNITGIDTFTYVANDGTSNSAPAVVTIDVTPPTNSFFDDFSRTTPANTFSPWVIGLGEWNVTNNTLQGTAAIANDYSDAYIPGNWTNFSIQARITLPAGAWAGGLSARVNPATGARYVANIYPEGSGLGPTPALRLIKFHSWNTWSDTFTPMALVSLPRVGTSTHTLNLTVQGNQITAFFDGSQVASVADTNIDGLAPYTSGAAGAHMYMDGAFVANFDDLSITQIFLTNSAPVLPAQPNRTIAAQTTLLVTNTATDTDVPTQALTYQLISPPAGAAINLSGLISWTPTAAQAPSTNLITTVVTDNGTPALSATNSFTVIVTAGSTNAPGQLFADDFTRGTDPGPIAPWIAQSGTWTVTGGALRAGTNTLQTYGSTYITNSWTNFAIQAQVRFPSGGFGGGLGSRLNRNTGARYAAWIYPEGSPGGSSMLKLVKFQTWTSWSYNGASFTPMQQASLPGVGTNWHTLKLGCYGNQISVSYDGTVYINTTDTEATPYLTGGASVDLWTDTARYSMLVDNLVVTSLVNNSLNSIKPLIPPASEPVIKSVALKDGAAVITWTANPGSVYRLQFKDDFNSPKWLDAEPDIIATDTEASATNSIVGAPQRFYRVLVLP
jgi:hypothetical protein